MSILVEVDGILVAVHPVLWGVSLHDVDGELLDLGESEVGMERALVGRVLEEGRREGRRRRK